MNRTRALSIVFTLVILAGAAVAFRHGAIKFHFSSNSLLGQLASVLDSVVGSSESKPVQKTFSTIGVVSSLLADDSQSTVVLSDVRGAGNDGETTYKIERSDINKIESSTYSPLDLSGIKMGDTIIIQGSRDESGALTPRRIIVLVSATTTSTSTFTTSVTNDSEVATSSATTSIMIDATSTDAVTATTSLDTTPSSESGVSSTETTSPAEQPAEPPISEPMQ